MEYKDYHNFMLGFNDPPPLVKEHAYLLLNRSTHTLEPANETGWQTEFFYTFDAGHALTFNLAQATNELFSNRFFYKEQFFELSYYVTPAFNIKAFIDHGADGLFAEKDRQTLGIYFEHEWSNRWGAILDYEYQTFTRDLFEDQNINNQALMLTFSYAPDLALGFVAERSNDPNDLKENKELRYWLGGNISYQYSQTHLLSLFYGTRRGGRACTAGICYEILPFEGIELRINSIL
jgi:hypothetical protein